MRATKHWSSADLDAAITRVTPDVLALFGDGVARSEAAIVAVPADRHPKDDVRRTLMRLDITEQLGRPSGRQESGHGPAADAGAGQRRAGAARHRQGRSRMGWIG
jgi:hypothetical protein